jgi:N-methylhydantoinase A
MTGLRFGVDVGGTFTDVVARDEVSGRLAAVKVPTVPDAQQQAVVAGIRRLLDGDAQIAGVVHGTTVVTNALLEGRSADVALVTTAGFRDVLEIGRQSRDALYHLDRPGRAEPLVPRHRRLEVDERTRFDGHVERPLPAEAAQAVAQRLALSGAEAVAICLLHAYANPAHERALAAVLADSFDYVCTSSEVNAEFREYERTSTVVLNAAVMPIIDRYLRGLDDGLTTLGQRVPLHIVQSSGGMLSSALARRQPLRMVMSGPAAGVAAARDLLGQLGCRDAVTFDMGGTSTDVCLVADGGVEMVRERKIDGRTLRTPSVPVESIGAGGGSVAWLDAVGALKVGPRSAGARPGPATYGLGGSEPTVTDANVVVGYIRPGLVFGETIRIDADAAAKAVERVATRLGLSVPETAQGILRIADASMLRAIRRVSVEKGYDLRRFSLVAYGGAGPLHAGRLAQALGIPRVVVPAHASIFSAFGCLVSDLRYDRVQTFRARLSTLDPRQLESRFQRLEHEARAPLLAESDGHATIQVQRSLDLRYAGQNYELEVPVAPGETAATIRARYNALHQARYTYDTPEDVECVNLRLVAWVPSPRVELAPAMSGRRNGRPRAIVQHPARFPGLGQVPVPVFRRADLGPWPVPGPALIEDTQTTIIVCPGQSARADNAGHLYLEEVAG